jgi:hypothetical protein
MMPSLITIISARNAAMDLSTRQITALAILVGACEGIASHGLLPEDTELAFRKMIAEVLTVFGLPHHQENAA